MWLARVSPFVYPRQALFVHSVQTMEREETVFIMLECGQIDCIAIMCIALIKLLFLKYLNGLE